MVNWACWKSNMGGKEKKCIWVLDSSPTFHGSVFPIYHSFIQAKVILFPDLVLGIKWTNSPPHFIHKGVILLIICRHDNSVCFFVRHPFLCAESQGKTLHICIFRFICPLSGCDYHSHKPVIWAVIVSQKQGPNNIWKSVVMNHGILCYFFRN